ncbi:ricin B-like lectin R40C1 [Carex rostrata]
MGESEDQIYRIICHDKTDYSLAIRGENVVLALTHPFDRSQHWMKDDTHGATIKDCEGQPAFALVSRATGQAISHGPTSQPLSLVQYNVNSCDESVLWTMSKDVDKVFKKIRRVNEVFYAQDSVIHDGHHVDLSGHHWKFENISPSTCISLFRPSQHTVKISYREKEGYNLAIDKQDGSTVLLVPANPKDKYQHWVKEMAYGVPVKDEKGQEAFALVNKATGKAIKHGFGSWCLVQVAPFNRNYMDPSLLWTESSDVLSDGFRNIRMQNNINRAFYIWQMGEGNLLVGLVSFENRKDTYWKIEDFV